MCRRWQGVALGVWGAAASARAEDAAFGIPVCYHLLMSFLRVPSLCSLALETPASRSTVLRVYTDILVGEQRPFCKRGMAITSLLLPTGAGR